MRLLRAPRRAGSRAIAPGNDEIVVTVRFVYPTITATFRCQTAFRRRAESARSRRPTADRIGRAARKENQELEIGNVSRRATIRMNFRARSGLRRGLYSLLRKGGDPAAGSPTATLLRLRPSHCARLRPLDPLRVSARTSGARSSHGVTGGVYKARERIHRGVADPRLLAIPASWRRVAASNPH